MNHRYLHVLTNLLLSLACLFTTARADEEDIDYRSDLRLETIQRAMARESQRNDKVQLLLQAQRTAAENILDDLEKKYEELHIAVFFQDFNNFFYLTHYCREIAELRQRCTSGNFPLMRTRLRMEMAIQRYGYLAQIMRGINKAKLSAEEREQLQTALRDCSGLEKTYKELHKEMLGAEKRFNDITEKIRKLDLYANGSQVERYAFFASDRTPIDLKKIIDFNEKNKASEADKGKVARQAAGKETGTTMEKAQQLEKEGDATDQRRAEFLEKAVEEAKAYGTDVDVTGKFSIENEQKVEGRLAARIATSLWDPSHPYRKMDNTGNYITTWLYLGKAFYNNYIDPNDTYFAASLRQAGVFFVILLVVTSLLCRCAWHLCRRQRLQHISPKRLRAAMLPLACTLLGVGLIVYSLFVQPSYLGSHLMDMGEFMLISAMLFGSMTVCLNSRRVLSGIRLFEPLFVLNLLCIVYCVMMCTSFIVAMTSGIIFALCALWMILRFLKRIDNLRISARVFAVLSIFIMAVGVYVCYSGYYYLWILVELSWYVMIANIMLMSAISKAAKLVCRRVAANRHLKGYHHYINVWIHLIVSNMVQPLIFLLLIWYGLSWSSECFDLAHFLRSWMGVPHHMDGFIRTVSADSLILIITVGIALNCLIQVARQTIAMIYGDKTDAGRSQTFMTLAALLLWCSYVIFALDLLDADYNSMLVVMGGMSVGVGIGLKDTIENLVCGISLMLGRMRPGDMVECDGIRGRVANIGYRTTTLETLSGSVICFQNAQLFNQNFNNLTRNHQYENCKVEIGVTYGTDVAYARRLILAALRRLPGLSPQHSSTVTLSEFADSAVNLTIWVWVPVNAKQVVLSRVREAIYKTFNENGIEIPFPQQDLYIKPLPGAGNPITPPQQG
ncbi:MAG: mechanosensitive ion channel family protein [Akkermansia sp.]|nr:mechanosensitive ion channel family protein [Akkermansia sp.]